MCLVKCIAVFYQLGCTVSRNKPGLIFNILRGKFHPKQPDMLGGHVCENITPSLLCPDE